MAFRVLLVFLALLLTIETERSKHLSTRDHLCLCGDRVLRIQFPSMDAKESSAVFCDKKCTADAKTERLSNGRLRTRRETDEKVCNSDRSLPRWIVKNLTVAFYDRGNSSDWYAKVSWNPLTDSSQAWRGYCLFYVTGKASNNPDPEKASISFLLKNQTTINISSSSQEKQILLSVIALPMLPSPNSTAPRIALLTFGLPTESTYQVIPFYPTKKATSTKSPDTITYVYVSMSIGILVGLALVGGLLTYFLYRKKHSIPLPSDFEYHAFIIYNNEDRLWMKNKLLPLLEEKHRLTCCVHYRNFALGKPFRDNMADSVYKSYKVIALFSSNFVKSNYCKYELDLAIGRLVANRDRSLVVIRLDEVDCKELPSELKNKSFIDYNDSLERPFWKRKLLKFLGEKEDSGSCNATGEQNCDNNNSNGHLGGNRTRIEFNRLESTTSTDTVISTL